MHPNLKVWRRKRWRRIKRRRIKVHLKIHGSTSRDHGFALKYKSKLNIIIVGGQNGLPCPPQWLRVDI